MRFLNWGPTTVWHDIESEKKIILKITPPYLAAVLDPGGHGDQALGPVVGHQPGVTQAGRVITSQR